MSLIQRISTSIHASIERLVDLMENHEAVVDLALDESRKALARGKSQLGRVQRESERLRRRIEALEAEEIRWTERARATAGGDEQTALQCVQRRRDCRQQIDEIRGVFVEHSATEERLAAELRASEDRLQAVTRQRNRLRTRQSAAEVNRALGGIAERFPPNLEETFERWEARVLEDELAGDRTVQADPLEERFSKQESDAELRAELSAILMEQGADDGR